MQCSLCPKVAFYQVGREYFCGDHKAQAYDAERKKRNRKLGDTHRVDIENEAQRLVPAGAKFDRPRHTL
jgi:hypothetical protein